MPHPQPLYKGPPPNSVSKGWSFPFWTPHPVFLLPTKHLTFAYISYRFLKISTRCGTHCILFSKWTSPCVPFFCLIITNPPAHARNCRVNFDFSCCQPFWPHIQWFTKSCKFCFQYVPLLLFSPIFLACCIPIKSLVLTLSYPVLKFVFLKFISDHATWPFCNQSPLSTIWNYDVFTWHA